MVVAGQRCGVSWPHSHVASALTTLCASSPCIASVYSEGTFSLIELMVVLDRQPAREDVAQIDIGLVELYGFFAVWDSGHVQLGSVGEIVGTTYNSWKVCACR